MFLLLLLLLPHLLRLFDTLVEIQNDTYTTSPFQLIFYHFFHVSLSKLRKHRGMYPPMIQWEWYFRFYSFYLVSIHLMLMFNLCCSYHAGSHLSVSIHLMLMFNIEHGLKHNIVSIHLMLMFNCLETMVLGNHFCVSIHLMLMFNASSGRDVYIP